MFWTILMIAFVPDYDQVVPNGTMCGVGVSHAFLESALLPRKIRYFLEIYPLIILLIRI